MNFIQLEDDTNNDFEHPEFVPITDSDSLEFIAINSELRMSDLSFNESSGIDEGSYFKTCWKLQKSYINELIKTNKAPRIGDPYWFKKYSKKMIKKIMRLLGQNITNFNTIMKENLWKNSFKKKIYKKTYSVWKAKITKIKKLSQEKGVDVPEWTKKDGGKRYRGVKQSLLVRDEEVYSFFKQYFENNK